MTLVTRNEQHEPVTHKAAFRCQNCGHLVHSATAGERTHPYACPVCKGGVIYGNTIEQIRKEKPELFTDLDENEITARTTTARIAPGVSITHFAVHENWQPLADLSDDELAMHGLTPEQVEKHVPEKKDGNVERAAKVVAASATDGPKTVDQAG